MLPNYTDLRIERAEPLEFDYAALGRPEAFVVHRRSYDSILQVGNSAAAALSPGCPIRFGGAIDYLAC
jgi:hypothetical protein